MQSCKTEYLRAASGREKTPDIARENEEGLRSEPGPWMQVLGNKGLMPFLLGPFSPNRPFGKHEYQSS